MSDAAQTPQPDRANSIRVMTWNVWGRFENWEERQPALAAVIGAQQPDVVLLQESWADREGRSQPDELAAALGGFHTAWPRDFRWRDSWFGNAILSRWPVLHTERHWLHRLDGGRPHRHVTVAVLDTPWGEWPVASTHFEYPFDASAQRILNAQELLQVIASRQGDRVRAEAALPFIIGADLNAVPDSDEVHVLTGRKPGVRGAVLSDVWELVGAGGRLGYEGVTWNPRNPYLQHTAWPNRRLDYLLVSWPRRKPVGNPLRAWIAGDQPVGEGSGALFPSDHFAVVAEFYAGEALRR